MSGRKWCKRCGQRLKQMKPGDECHRCGWVWEKTTRPSVVRRAREICRMLKKEGCRLAAPIPKKQSYEEED